MKANQPFSIRSRVQRWIAAPLAFAAVMVVGSSYAMADNATSMVAAFGDWHTFCEQQVTSPESCVVIQTVETSNANVRAQISFTTKTSEDLYIEVRARADAAKIAHFSFLFDGKAYDSTDAACDDGGCKGSFQVGAAFRSHLTDGKVLGVGFRTSPGHGIIVPFDLSRLDDALNNMRDRIRRVAVVADAKRGGSHFCAPLTPIAPSYPAGAVVTGPIVPRFDNPRRSLSETDQCPTSSFAYGTVGPGSFVGQEVKRFMLEKSLHKDPDAEAERIN